MTIECTYHVPDRGKCNNEAKFNYSLHDEESSYKGINRRCEDHLMGDTNPRALYWVRTDITPPLILIED